MVLRCELTWNPGAWFLASPSNLEQEPGVQIKIQIKIQNKNPIKIKSIQSKQFITSNHPKGGGSLINSDESEPKPGAKVSSSLNPNFSPTPSSVVLGGSPMAPQSNVNLDAVGSLFKFDRIHPLIVQCVPFISPLEIRDFG